MKFRLNAGIHTCADPDWKPSKADEATIALGRSVRPPTRTYEVGDVIETDKDLIKLFGNEKFTRVDFSGKTARVKGPDPVNNNPATPEMRTIVEDNDGVVIPGDAGKSAEPEAGLKDGFNDSKAPADENDLSSASHAGTRTIADIEHDYGQLDQMTVADLKTLAAQEDIDVSRATHKAEIVKAIRKAAGK